MVERQLEVVGVEEGVLEEAEVVEASPVAEMFSSFLVIPSLIVERVQVPAGGVPEED